MYLYDPEKEFPIEFRYRGKTKSKTGIQIIARNSIEQEQTSNLNESEPKKIVEMPTIQTEDPAFTLDMIPGGCFLVARKIFKSEIWLKHPFYLKTWLWIFGNANYSDQQKHRYSYKRGELITTYDEIIKGAAYYFNRQHIVPTLKQVRIILQWLESEQMIIVEPLRANDPTERPTGADPRARTRAYLGIRIIVVNYNTYQNSKSYKGRDKGRPSVQLGHNTNKEQERSNIYGQNFLTFWKAYPNKVAKKKAHEAWNKLEKIEDMKTLLPTLLDAIEKQKQAKEIKKAKGEFTPEWPHGATWLNDKRWEDEVEIKKRWDHAK